MGMTIRGITSGLDINHIIEALVALEKRPLVKMQQQKDTWQVHRDTWRDINTRLRNLQNTLLGLRQSVTFTQIGVTSSNDSTLTASVTSDVVGGTYAINVEQLATKHQLISGQFTVVNHNLESGVINFPLDLSESPVTLYVGDQDVLLEGLYSTTSELAGYLNSELADVTVETVGNQLRFSSATDFNISVVGEGSTLLEVLNGQSKEVFFEANSSFAIQQGEESYSLEIEAGSNLGDVINSINNSDAQVQATIIDRRLVLESTIEGIAGVFEIVEDGGGVFTSATINEAQNSRVSINGITTEAYGNTIEGFIHGTTLKLHDVGMSSMTVSRHFDQAVARIKAFVGQYNSTLGFINEKTTERATLQGDGTAVRLGNTLRRMVSTNMSEGVFKNINDIGISTGKANATVGVANTSGKLEIDETQLLKALSEDSEAVHKLFYDNTESSPKGLVQEIDDYLQMYTRFGTGILSEKEKSIERITSDINRQMNRLELRVEMRRDRLVQQFTAMETALSTMQNQGQWMAGQLNHLSNFNWSGHRSS